MKDLFISILYFYWKNVGKNVLKCDLGEWAKFTLFFYMQTLSWCIRQACAPPHALAERGRRCVSCWHEHTLKGVHSATFSMTSYDQNSLWNTGLSNCNGVEQTLKCHAWRPITEKQVVFPQHFISTWKYKSKIFPLFFGFLF